MISKHHTLCIGNRINRHGTHGTHFETSNILPVDRIVYRDKANNADEPSSCRYRLDKSNGFHYNDDNRHHHGVSDFVLMVVEIYLWFEMLFYFVQALVVHEMAW